MLRARSIAAFLTLLIAIGALVMASSGGSEPTRPRTAPQAQSAAVDRYVRQARARYKMEAEGTTIHQKLNRAASAPGLRKAVAGGDLAAIRAAAQFQQIGTHQHISHLQVIRGSRVVADYGVPFCVRGAQKPITFRGRNVGTLRIAIQDEIGFVRLMSRLLPINVVTRGGGHALTSWAPLLRLKLPDSGTVRVAGRRFAVRSFGETSFEGTPVKIWIVARG